MQSIALDIKILNYAYNFIDVLNLSCLDFKDWWGNNFN